MREGSTRGEKERERGMKTRSLDTAPVRRSQRRTNSQFKHKSSPAKDCRLDALLQASVLLEKKEQRGPKALDRERYAQSIHCADRTPVRYMAKLWDELSGRFLGYIALVPNKALRHTQKAMGFAKPLAPLHFKVHGTNLPAQDRQQQQLLQQSAPAGEGDNCQPHVAAPSPFPHAHSSGSSPFVVPSTPGATPMSACGTPMIPHS